MRRRTVPAWLWTALLLVLCLLPRQLTPESRPLPLTLPHLDKLAHAAMFAAFGLLWSRAVVPSRRERAIFVIGLMLAVGTELTQGLFLIDRDPDFLDALADVAGLLAGMGTYRFVPWPSTA